MPISHTAEESKLPTIGKLMKGINIPSINATRTEVLQVSNISTIPSSIMQITETPYNSSSTVTVKKDQSGADEMKNITKQLIKEIQQTASLPTEKYKARSSNITDTPSIAHIQQTTHQLPDPQTNEFQLINSFSIEELTKIYLDEESQDQQIGATH